MAFIEWINERVLFIDMHTNWYQWYCGHFSGVVNEWCFNCHLDTNHINCGRDQGILTSNCGIMNFVAWKNKFPIFCFHKGTGIIYHQEQSLGHQRQHNAGQCLFWHWVTAQAPGAAPLPPQRVKTTPSPRPAQSTATHASELQLGCYHLGATGVGLGTENSLEDVITGPDLIPGAWKNYVSSSKCVTVTHTDQPATPTLYNTNNTAITNCPWVPHGEIIGNVPLNSFSPHDSFRYTK